MALIGVAEAAERLGVGVARIHQRIADGSLSAVRIGAQWVIDEASLDAVADSNAPGRPLSGRSAWALVALVDDNQRALGRLAHAERSRARRRLSELLAKSRPGVQHAEGHVKDVAALLRSLMRSRADRRLYRAASLDLPALRRDERVTLAGLSHDRSGIASGDIVEGYVSTDVLAAVVDDHLLSSVDKSPNVVLHVVGTEFLDAVDGLGRLLLAADLADHRGPREEARAVEVLREIAEQHRDLATPINKRAGTRT
jgi:excisionase family DNA binding protein